MHRPGTVLAGLTVAALVVTQAALGGGLATLFPTASPTPAWTERGDPSGGIDRVNGSVEEASVVPATTSRPPGLSDAQAQALREGKPVELSSPRPLPYSSFRNGTIQPGAMILPGWCTLGFIFQNNQTGAYGAVTAGHCVNQTGTQVSVVQPLANVSNPEADIPNASESGFPVTDREPQIFADGADTFYISLFKIWFRSSSATVTSPDGDQMTVAGSPLSPTLVFAEVRLDGTVASVTNGWTCEPLDPNTVHVSGSLAGAAVNGTWTIARSNALFRAFSLQVQNKTFHVRGAKAQEGCIEEGHAPTRSVLTWNWHETDHRHEAQANPCLPPEQSPEQARVFAPNATGTDEPVWRTIEENWRTIRPPVTCPEVRLVSQPIGKATAVRANGVGDDLALIEIRANRSDKVDPRIKRIDGPCGSYPGYLTLQDTWPNFSPTSMPVLHYGHGLAIGSGGTPRLGWGSYPDRANSSIMFEHKPIIWEGAATGGDSGSPVRTWAGDSVRGDVPLSGQAGAAGILTHSSGVNPSVHYGTSIERINEVIDPEWRLVSSPACPLDPP